MRHILVSGTQTLSLTADDIDQIFEKLNIETDSIGCIVGGLDYGPELAAGDWALQHNKFVDAHQAHLSEYGNLAWVIRNKVVISHSDTIIICWDGKSAGARQLANGGVKAGKKVYVVRFTDGKASHPMEWVGQTKSEWTEWTSTW